MLKLEIELDVNILNSLDYDIEKVTEFISDGIKKVGLIEEKNENGYFLYRGPGLNTDLAYIGIVVNALTSQDYIKSSCKKMLLLDNEDSKDGSFYVDSDWIKTYKEYGKW